MCNFAMCNFATCNFATRILAACNFAMCNFAACSFATFSCGRNFCFCQGPVTVSILIHRLEGVIELLELAWRDVHRDLLKELLLYRILLAPSSESTNPVASQPRAGRILPPACVEDSSTSASPLNCTPPRCPPLLGIASGRTKPVASRFLTGRPAPVEEVPSTSTDSANCTPSRCAPLLGTSSARTNPVAS